MGFPRQEYWSGLPFPFPGDLPDPGIESRSRALQTDTLLSEPPGKPMHTHMKLSIPIVGNFKKLTEFPGAELNRDTGDLSSKSAGTSLDGPEAQQRPRALMLLASHEVTVRKSVKISQTAALPAAEPR